MSSEHKGERHEEVTMYGIHPDTVREIAVSEAAELRLAAGRKRQRRVPSASRKIRHTMTALVVR